MPELPTPTLTKASRSVLWLAQGLGIGRIPIAPGTFGSSLGLVWFFALLLPASVWLFAAGGLAGIAGSIWICGEAERLLDQRDPGSVVLDEIVALPLCFGSWMGWFLFRHHEMPSPEYFLSPSTAPLTIGVFLAFRLFDVWKPWPIRQSQQLPGGWGVTIDDVLAALLVNLPLAIALAIPAVARHAFPELRR